MIKERVQQYCKYKNMGISRFEKLAGLSNGYFNQVTKRPSDNSLLKISKAHPDLNLAWLLTGTGPMLEPADNPICGNVTRIGNISGVTNSPTSVNNNGGGDNSEIRRQDTSRQLYRTIFRRELLPVAHEQEAEIFRLPERQAWQNFG